jgi:hypothetical protein
MTNNQQIKNVRSRIAKDTFDYDEEGRVIIEVKVADPDYLLSPYKEEQEIISGETATFIDNLVKSAPKDKNLHLKLYCKNYTPDKRDVYKRAVENYYVNEFADKDRQLEHNLFMAMTMFVLGVIGFALLYLMNVWGVPWIICELVDVAAWVFVWETVDLLMIRRVFIKLQQKKDLKIIFAKMTFKDCD